MNTGVRAVNGGDVSAKSVVKCAKTRSSLPTIELPVITRHRVHGADDALETATGNLTV
jgi:hypothetical protein